MKNSIRCLMLIAPLAIFIGIVIHIQIPGEFEKSLIYSSLDYVKANYEDVETIEYVKIKDNNNITIEGNRCRLECEFNDEHELVKSEFKINVLEIILNTIAVLFIIAIACVVCSIVCLVIQEIFGC